MENVVNRIRLKSILGHITVGFLKEVGSDCYSKGLVLCKGSSVLSKTNFRLNLKKRIKLFSHIIKQWPFSPVDIFQDFKN